MLNFNPEIARNPKNLFFGLVRWTDFQGAPKVSLESSRKLKQFSPFEKPGSSFRILIPSFGKPGSSFRFNPLLGKLGSSFRKLIPSFGKPGS